MYTVKEFLSDILGCEARRVLIVADQSNSDVLLRSLKESSEHNNVVLFTAGLPNQVTSNGELTALWANHSQSSSCINRIYKVDFLNFFAFQSKLRLVKSSSTCDLCLILYFCVLACC